ncbi:MAG: hypothetical protein HBSAPP03_17690 [Phycisphaerae bacterium]|nr:MAG: hypothetical protein HBSAPP03_17690 [Phycisphaerae bacterium]
MGHECCSGDAHGAETKAEGCCGGKAKAEGGGCCREVREPLTPMTVEQLQAMPTAALIQRFRRGIEAFDRRVFELTEEMIDRAFLPEANVGRWPVRVLIGHVADADLAAIHRMRRAAAEDSPVFTEWDENAFVDAGLYGNGPKQYAETPDGDHARVMNALGGYLATIHTLRQWTGQWLAGMTESQLARTGMHPTYGPLSVRTILAMYTWHLEHHAGFLTKKLDLMLGPVVEEETPAAGGCGCHS